MNTKHIRLLGAAGWLAASLLCANTAAVSWAQVTPDDPIEAQDETFEVENGDEGFDWGWIGLLGLLGLAGLKRRDRDPRDRDQAVRARA